MISDKEIAQRKPVWIALSEFYLDMELDDRDLERIAGVFIQSGYSLTELKRINYEEVAPVLYSNFLSVAGVWTGFDEEWLLTEIIARLPKRKSIFGGLFRRFIDRLTKGYWDRMAEIGALEK